MKTFPYILVTLALLSLGGCNGATALAAIEGSSFYLSKPKPKPAADMQAQIAEHESWCYETMGYPECYTYPQDVDPNRLINVDPPNRYPLTARAYKDDVLAVKSY